MREIQRVFCDYIQLERRRDADELCEAEEDEWAKLKQRLNLHSSPQLKLGIEERRASIRIPVSLALRYASTSEMGETRLTQISRGGVFIPTGHPPKVGTRLSLRIELDGGGELHVVGVVASHNTSETAGIDQTGMGVRFERLSDRQRKLVDDLYEQAGQRAVGLTR